MVNDNLDGLDMDLAHAAETIQSLEKRVKELEAGMGEPLSGLPFAILDEEMDALRRFTECAEDGEGYDVPKNTMKRLAEIGLLNHLSAGYYEHTNFGLAVLHGEFRTPPAVAAAEDRMKDVRRIVLERIIQHAQGFGISTSARYSEARIILQAIDAAIERGK